MRVALVLVVLAGMFDASTASAMRCGTRLVREGDTRDRVRQACGEPTDVSERVEERSAREVTTLPGASPTAAAAHGARGSASESGSDGAGASASSTRNPPAVPRASLSATITVVVESWTYNFGPDRAMQRVVFYDGVVAHIETLGRGYGSDEPSPTTRQIRLGDSRDRVRAVWGDPADTNVSVIERAWSERTGRGALRTPGGVQFAQGGRVRVTVETWTFNFGPQRLQRRVVFEDGRVVQVETLRPGY